MLATFALSLLLSVQATSLTKPSPNFSGKWVAIPGRSQPDFLPAGDGVTINQDSKTFAVQRGTGPVRSYRLDGQATQYQDRGATLTARASWVGAKLTITEERQGWKRAFTYFFDDGLQSELSITSSTTLLHTRSGKLTVSTIGPWTRVYGKRGASPSARRLLVTTGRQTIASRYLPG